MIPRGPLQGNGRLPGGLLLGRRQSAVWLFLFGVKKEPKNRHRFEAVDADQGYALDPSAATPPGRPTQALGGLSKVWI